MKTRTMRAVVPYRPPVEPFLKWVGGKRRLLPQLVPLLPKPSIHRTRYMEPFVGGGALFFHERPERALLADVNESLIATYVSIRDEVDAVIDCLEWLEVRHDVGRVYYAMRERFNAGVFASTAERAATFLYLNRTGFNGLYRVNRGGALNVPEGKYTNPGILNTRMLYAASIALEGVELQCQDFEATVASAARGDFVYFDPPYVPITATSSFVGYDEGGFGNTEQMVLRDAFRDLDRRGCKVMLSNSNAPLVHRLYRDYRIDVVTAPRSINSDATRRGDVEEVIVRNY